MTCLPCNPLAHCKTCKDAGVDPSGCLTCADGYYLQLAPKRECRPCHEVCSLCTGPEQTQCQDCKAGFYLYQGIYCSATCEEGAVGKYKIEKAQSPTGIATCGNCHASCKKCNGPTEKDCTECPDRYFKNSQNACDQCSSSCLKCLGPDPNQCDCRSVDP